MPLAHATDLVAGRLHENLHIRLIIQQLIDIDQDWDYSDVYGTVWRLYINDRDGAYVDLTNGDSFGLTGGRVHLVPPWVRFTCRCKRVMKHFFIHFDLIGLPAALVRRIFTGPYTVSDDAVAQPLAKALLELLEHGQGRELAAISLGKALAHVSIADWVSRLPAQAARSCRQFASEPNPVRPAMRYIEQHLGEALTNAQLADLCHLSPHHFIRVFQKTVGQTPARYLLERRVATAAERLVFSDDSIPQIAEQYGFPNRFHFSRAFAKIIGIPPAAYRKAVRA